MPRKLEQMLEALAEDALIHLRGLLPSSLAEQPCSTGYGRWSDNPEATHSTGGWSGDGALEPSGAMAAGWVL